jgi:hypothetical protein
MIFIGIDPGKGGGVAVIFEGGHADAYPMPETDREILDLLREYAPPEGKESGVFACLERINAFSPGRQACFQLGQSYGKLKMGLIACGIPYSEVLPAAWQKAVGCPPAKGRTYAQRKALLRARAQALFPQFKVVNSTADSLLICSYIKATRIP